MGSARQGAGARRQYTEEGGGYYVMTGEMARDTGQHENGLLGAGLRSSWVEFMMVWNSNGGDGLGRK